MRPIRVAAGLCAVLGWSACRDITPSLSPYVVLDPVLDSLLVGDQSPPPRVTYYDRAGNSRTPAFGEVSWASSDSSVLSVNDATGRMTALHRGIAIIIATVQSARGGALIAVSNALDLTLLLDTVYTMPGDTLTLPVAVQKQNSPPAPVVWYEAPPSNGFYTIDSASGRLTAIAVGGPTPYIAHADTIADTGAVYVVSLADTTGGKFFFSVLGTVVSHVGGSVRAVNYTRTNGKLAFQLMGTRPFGSVTQQTVQVILPDSVIAAGPYGIDSLSLGEGAALPNQPVVICSPPRPWALWSSQTPTITAFSRQGGSLGITQIVTVPNGKAISGRFTYTAQRSDRYTDPLGVLVVHGSFVAPLVTDRTSCR